MWQSSPRGEMDATKQFHHQAWNFGYFFTLIWKLKSKKSGVVDGGGSMASMESDISFMMKVGKPEEKAAFKSRKKKKKITSREDSTTAFSIYAHFYDMKYSNNVTAHTCWWPSPTTILSFPREQFDSGS